MSNQKRTRQKEGRQRRLEERRRLERRRQVIRLGIVGAVVAAVVFGSVAYFISSGTATTTLPTTTTTSPTAIPARFVPIQDAANKLAVAAGCPASTAAPANTLQWTKRPAMTINTSTNYYAHVVTTAGNFVIELEPKKAPITVNSFVFLSEHKFYKCVIFQRVIPGEFIQGGDPTGTGSGGPGYTIPDEFPKAAKNNINYPLYSVAMANTGAANSGGSQFFIVTGKAFETLPPQYTLFGRIYSGFSVVHTIQADGNPNPTAGSNGGVPPFVTDRMLSVTISTTP